MRKFVYLLIIIVLVSSCKNRFDAFEYDVINSDEVYYYTEGVKIKINTDSINNITDRFIENFTPKEIKNKDLKLKSRFLSIFAKDTSNYLKKLSNEASLIKSASINTLHIPTKWSVDRIKNHKYARYFYDGYLHYKHFLSTDLYIYADKNMNVTVLKFIKRYDGGDKIHESYVYENNQIVSISRVYSVPHTEGFLLSSYVKWSSNSEFFKFFDNMLCEKSVSPNGKNIEFFKDISNKESIKYLKKAIYFRNLAQSILDSKEIKCIETDVLYKTGTPDDITQYFNENFNKELLDTIDNDNFYFKERFELKINEKGKLISYNILFPDSYKTKKHKNNEDYHNIVLKEIGRLLKEIQFTPATKDCKKILSEASINIGFNEIYKRELGRYVMKPHTKGYKKFKLSHLIQLHRYSSD